MVERKNEPSTPFSFRIPTAVLSQLHKLAAADQRSTSEYVRIVLRSVVETHGFKVKR